GALLQLDPGADVPAGLLARAVDGAAGLPGRPVDGVDTCRARPVAGVEDLDRALDRRPWRGGEDEVAGLALGGRLDREGGLCLGTGGGGADQGERQRKPES